MARVIGKRARASGRIRFVDPCRVRAMTSHRQSVFAIGRTARVVQSIDPAPRALRTFPVWLRCAAAPKE